MEAVLNGARTAELWAAVKREVSAAKGGLFAFAVEDGNLILRYNGTNAPELSIHEDGCLYAQLN